MAVAADDLALFNLLKQRFPVAMGEYGADRARLIAYVIELKYDRIGLSAVGTGMALEVSEEVLASLARQPMCFLARARSLYSGLFAS